MAGRVHVTTPLAHRSARGGRRGHPRRRRRPGRHLLGGPLPVPGERPVRDRRAGRGDAGDAPVPQQGGGGLEGPPVAFGQGERRGLGGLRRTASRRVAGRGPRGRRRAGRAGTHGPDRLRPARRRAAGDAEPPSGGPVSGQVLQGSVAGRAPPATTAAARPTAVLRLAHDQPAQPRRGAVGPHPAGAGGLNPFPATRPDRVRAGGHAHHPLTRSDSSPRRTPSPRRTRSRGRPSPPAR